ncbi:MAG: hypothetical protein ACR2OB_07050 [Solirubrobacteraceae bacterium]
MDFVIVLAILAIVVLVVSAPLRRGEDPEAHRLAGPASADGDSIEIAELEAARAAKYRELRDAELDHRTGKLSDADYEAVDHELRAEAIKILRALDRAGAAVADGGSGGGGEDGSVDRASAVLGDTHGPERTGQTADAERPTGDAQRPEQTGDAERPEQAGHAGGAETPTPSQ